MARRESEYCGILLVNKEQDMTSHDCVNIVRRGFQTGRVGHTGTLDPMATGLLPICVGKATKLAELICDGRKKYRAGFRLGVRTDTLDITGSIIREAEPERDWEKVREVIFSFLGRSMQLPPMYSAKKINGQKLYELARKGEEIERTPCEIEIYNIEADSFNPDDASGEMTVSCSKGTYIRSLIDDMGEKLGCFAVMTSLERVETGGFSLSDERVCSIEEIKSSTPEKLGEKLILPEEFFPEFREITLNEKEERFFTNGIRIRMSGEKDEILKVYSPKGKFIALGKIFEENDKSLRMGVFKSFY